MSDWGPGDDDELARRLKDALRSEADRIEVPERYDEIVAETDRTVAARTPWRYAVAAALVGVVGLGIAWQLGILQGPGPASSAPQAAQSRVAERAPGDGAGSAASRSPGVAATSGVPGTGADRTVFGVTIGFATRSGNLVCLMDGSQVVCQAMAATAWEQAAPRPCQVLGGGATTYDYSRGGVALTAQGAQLVCGGQRLRLDVASPDPATSWYRPGSDNTVATPSGAVPVLASNVTAATRNGQRCTATDSAVACTDASGAGFQLSGERLSMAGPGGGVETVYGS